ncbi:MAG TPA: alpha/beta hydrolase [Burkholderiaceae bacterium]|nr:alpha/beta hydrolase [Burkholderiaceae bacterium]
MLIDILLVLALVGAVAWGLAAWVYRAEDLSAFDGPPAPPDPPSTDPVWRRLGGDAPPSPALLAVQASLAQLGRQMAGLHGRARVAALRRHLDGVFADRTFDARFVPVDCGGVPGEWVIPPGADPRRRTLYLHGGGFIIGSPLSHRTLTTRFAALTGGVVLAIDYRLMPEPPRRASIEDSRRAWRWLCTNGPDAAGVPADRLFVAGDSAGGNLALSLIAWLRHERRSDPALRQADAAVALSPLTDSCLVAPSLRRLRRSDVMLGPMLGKLVALPRWLLIASTRKVTGIDPRGPLLSPLRDDLSGLPPVLLQASEAEMLFDDAHRYARRAHAAGSPVRLQTWRHPVHAWPIFNPELPEANEALAQIGQFLAEVAPPGEGQPQPRAPGKAPGSAGALPSPA